LQHTEVERGASIGTRNCRLAALRSFFHFVAEREPAAIGQCTEVLHIPTKKATKPTPCYLESSEIGAILDQPDRKSLEGQRDHAPERVNDFASPGFMYLLLNVVCRVRPFSPSVVG
jgi:site-specific recombinase XerD